MLVAKLNANIAFVKEGFENYVNYAGSKTHKATSINNKPFENYVNYAGSKTIKNN